MNTVKLDNIALIVPVYNLKPNEYDNLSRIVGLFSLSIIVDDSKTYDTSIKEALENQGCIYLSNDSEQGLSRTVNRGIDYALSKEIGWVLILNQNSVIDGTIIEIYLKYIKTHNTEKIAILSPVYNYDRHRRQAGVGYKTVRYTDMTGSLINCEVYRNIGGYDSRFFIDGLDVEWCLRAKKCGYKIIRCNEAVINHHPGETRELNILGISVLKYGWHNASRYYYQYKAAFLIHDMYHDFCSDIFNLYKVLKSFIIFGNRVEYVKMFVKAIKDYENGNYGSLNETECK